MQSCAVSKYLDRIYKILHSKAPVFSLCLQTKHTQKNLVLYNYIGEAEVTCGQPFEDW